MDIQLKMAIEQRYADSVKRGGGGAPNGKEEYRKGEEFKCYHCSEAHAVKSKDYSKQKRESENFWIMKQKITFKRARQIQTG